MSGAPERPGTGLLPWLFPAMLGLTALDVLLSGRDLTQSYADLERSAQAAAPLLERGAIQVWAQRALSLLLIVATLQRIADHVLRGRPAPAPLLSAAFLLYWAASIGGPGLLGAHPRVSHEYAYPLLLGLACTMVEPREYERILLLLRNALFVSMAAGLPLLLLAPGLVMDWAYAQGLLPGLPRYGGLANSPVMMGILAQTALLVLWARPFRRAAVNRAAWLLGLAILVMAQSKTAWLSFLLGGACMWLVQGAAVSGPGPFHPRRSSTGVGLCLSLMAAVLLVLAGTLVFDLPGLLDDFFNSREGAQLASLTGRDRIWVVALEEWRNHPVFGYGLTMWDSGYRQEVGMPQATHAHNQLIDTLGRAGVVGAAGLVVYVGMLLAFAVRHARAGSGLGLAMGTSLALLCVSEVPLLLIDYGSHLLQHYLLVVTLAAAAGASVAQARPRPQVPLAPVPMRASDWALLPLHTIGLPARRAVLASGVLLVAAGPLSSGMPVPDAPWTQPGGLRLTLSTALDSRSPVPDVALAAEAGQPQVHLALELGLGDGRR
jgi:O-antigen ligase